MLKNSPQQFTMEITVISAQGLKNPSFFSHRLRPFITLTTLPSSPFKPTAGYKHRSVYQSRVDDEGGINPTWGDKFRLPLDATFFSHNYSSIYLQLYTKRLMAGKTQLGWCQIPAGDILDGLSPVGLVRHLSYRLRDRDGSRGHGVVNIAVKLEGQAPVCTQGVSVSDSGRTRQTVIGIPVTTVLPDTDIFRYAVTCNGKFGVGCREAGGVTSGREVGS